MKLYVAVLLFCLLQYTSGQPDNRGALFLILQSLCVEIR
jgi:hypothetical protein